MNADTGTERKPGRPLLRHGLELGRLSLTPPEPLQFVFSKNVTIIAVRYPDRLGASHLAQVPQFGIDMVGRDASGSSHED